MSVFKNRSLLLWAGSTICAALLSLAIISGGISKQIQDEDSCVDCHSQIVEIARNSRYTHSVVLTDCNICHIDESLLKPKEKITVETELPLQDFIIHIVPPFKSYYKLELNLQNDERQNTDTFTKEFKIEELQDLTRSLSPLRTPPSPVLVGLKKRGFITATLQWTTEVPTSTAVQCRKGSTGSVVSVEYPGLYWWKHRIDVSGLSRKHTYKCTVTSEDLFQNRMSSSIEIDPSLRLTRSELLSPGQNPTIKQINLFRVKDREGFFIEVHATQKAYCSVTIFKQQQKTANASKEHYPIGRYATMDACEQCHSFSVSHPVGIRATTEGVKVPRDMFTIDNGVITCATCHSPHGSELPFLGRFEFRKDLCLKCHDRSIYFK